VESSEAASYQESSRPEAESLPAALPDPEPSKASPEEEAVVASAPGSANAPWERSYS